MNELVYVSEQIFPANGIKMIKILELISASPLLIIIGIINDSHTHTQGHVVSRNYYSTMIHCNLSHVTALSYNISAF